MLRGRRASRGLRARRGLGRRWSRGVSGGVVEGGAPVASTDALGDPRRGLAPVADVVLADGVHPLAVRLTPAGPDGLDLGAEGREPVVDVAADEFAADLQGDLRGGIADALRVGVLRLLREHGAAVPHRSERRVVTLSLVVAVVLAVTVAVQRFVVAASASGCRRGALQRQG